MAGDIPWREVGLGRRQLLAPGLALLDWLLLRRLGGVDLGQALGDDVLELERGVSR